MISALHGIGVLKLVHQKPREALGGGRLDRRMVAQNIAAREQKVVEIEDGGPPFKGLVLRHHFIEPAREDPDDGRRDPSHQRAVSLAAPAEMLFRLIGKPLAVRTARLSPQRPAPVFPEIRRTLAHDRQPCGVRELQQAFEVGQGIEAPLEVGDQRLERDDVGIGFGWHVDLVAPAPEFPHALREFDVRVGFEIGRQRPRSPMASAEFGEAAQQSFGVDRITPSNRRDRIPGRRRGPVEPAAPPPVEDRVEREVGLIAVQDIRAGIDRGFDGIRLQEVVAERMDRSAGQFVEALRSGA
ncbi:hypothetical protein ACVWXL_007990 [Bradyrhizobium sp. GM22.5]